MIVKTNVVAHRWPVATARCPNGTKMTGGGGQCVSLGPPGSGWTLIHGSYPINDLEWKVHCDTPIEQNVRAEAYAICSSDEVTAMYNLHY